MISNIVQEEGLISKALFCCEPVPPPFFFFCASGFKNIELRVAFGVEGWALGITTNGYLLRICTKGSVCMR